MPELDIEKFYPSINHDLLKEMYRGIFKDKDLLWLIEEIIDSIDGGRGVVIGNYLSQYSGNLFLYKFDRWLKEDLKVKYYSRYMDDCCIFHSDKTYLHSLFGEIKQYISTNLDLDIKSNYQVFPSRVRGVDYVGYRHFGSYVLLRKTTAKNLIRKMRNIQKRMNRGDKFIYSDYCSINSYKGWLKWCNGYNLYNQWIKPLEPYADKYYREVIKMKVRGTQKIVKPVEVNVDTVYARSSITRISEEDFEGWEYEEETFSIKEYIEKLTSSDDTQSIAMLISMLMGEVDFLRSRIESLEGGQI